ncbi:hypothetical protein [Streptosporangium carneum]|uniref:Uncharacterized protein n=1 Tax=Streptosporangium carneum TaxID=47481 RepID=A0A9W6IAB8_9ACTN|nr:hypothetical protein [Streptosporangium carneum]GLK13775.1 hypothetical protein GCM10017600_71860 [Streptosporangium carneum]
MKWMSRVGVILLGAALIVGALSAFVAFRASTTKERIDGQLQRAAAALREAETVKESDPAQHEQLKQDAERYTGFAETDQQEYSSQQQGGWYLAGGALAALAGGVTLIAMGRSGTAAQRSRHM